MAKKIQNTNPGKKVRHLVFFSSGSPAPWRTTYQIDHTWFLTVFGEDNIKRPFDANEFIDFVHKNYDKGAVFELGDYVAVSNCAPTIYFSEMDIAKKFLADFTQILEKLV